MQPGSGMRVRHAVKTSATNNLAVLPELPNQTRTLGCTRACCNKAKRLQMVARVWNSWLSTGKRHVVLNETVVARCFVTGICTAVQLTWNWFQGKASTRIAGAIHICILPVSLSVVWSCYPGNCSSLNSTAFRSTPEHRS